MDRKDKFYLTLIMAALLIIFASAWVDDQPRISYYGEAGQ